MTGDRETGNEKRETDREKLCSRGELMRRAGDERSEGRIVVFANGAFDLLHAGHVRYLQGARRAGDWLAVGVNSDRSVRAAKGPSRPIVPESERAEIVASGENARSSRRRRARSPRVPAASGRRLHARVSAM